MEFPIGKTFFHLVANPGTSQCSTDFPREIFLPWTWNWYKLRETSKWNAKLQPGKRAHLFRFSTFSGNFPVGRTDETCSIYRRTGNPEILTKWKAPQNTSPCSPSPCDLSPCRNNSPLESFDVVVPLGSTCIACISADLKDSVFIKMRRWRWRRSDDL